MRTVHALECDIRFMSFVNANGVAHMENAFEHAVNLRWGDEILSIVAKSGYRAPHTAIVPACTSFTSVAPFEGKPLRSEDGILILPPVCAIDFSKCVVKTPPNCPIPSRYSRNAAIDDFDSVISILPVRGGCLDGYRRRWLGLPIDFDVVDEAIDRRVSRFTDMVCRGHAEQAAELVIGAGRGLTPSGDDFLCGFISALGQSELERDIFDKLVGSIRKIDLSKKTTPVSRQMLFDCCQGWHPSPHARLIESFSQHGISMRDAIQDLSRIGHTSGLDFAAGAAHAARLLRQGLHRGVDSIDSKTISARV